MDPGPDAVANARLIAQAPAMYAALWRVLIECCRFVPGVGWSGVLDDAAVQAVRADG